MTVPLSDHPAPAAAPSRRSSVQSIRAYRIDLLIVLVFAAVGRSTHEEQVDVLDVIGVIETALPFLVALLIASLILRTLRRPYEIWPTGVGVWIGTWALGMGIRALIGGGTAFAFVLVALGTLGAGMLGWRLIARFTPAADRPSGNTNV